MGTIARYELFELRNGTPPVPMTDERYHEYKVVASDGCVYVWWNGAWVREKDIPAQESHDAGANYYEEWKHVVLSGTA